MVLENKIQEHIGSSGGDEAGEDYGQGLVCTLNYKNSDRV